MVAGAATEAVTDKMVVAAVAVADHLMAVAAAAFHVSKNI